MTIESNISTINVSAAPSSGHPNLFLNQKEIDFIKQKVNTNQNPWLSAWNDVRTLANEAATKTSYPIITGNSNIDYGQGLFVKEWTRALALSYVLTNNQNHVQQAIKFIKAWGFHGNRYKISGNIMFNYQVMPGIMYAADLIWNSSPFQSTKVNYYGPSNGTNITLAEGMKRWTKDLADNSGEPGTTDPWKGQNYSWWYTCYNISLHTIRNDISKLKYYCQHFKDLIPLAIANNGAFPKEYRRPEGSCTASGMTYTGTGLGYSMYTLSAMIESAEIIRHHPETGWNLYTLKLTDGTNRGLEKTLDFHARFCSDSRMPNLWRNTVIFNGLKGLQAAGPSGKGSCEGAVSCLCSQGKCNGQNQGIWEVAYKGYKANGMTKSAYKSAIMTRGRPMEQRSAIGPTTLTHAID